MLVPVPGCSTGLEAPTWTPSRPGSWPRLLPDARSHVYPGGHLGLLTMADDLAALVSAFLG